MYETMVLIDETANIEFKKFHEEIKVVFSTIITEQPSITASKETTEKLELKWSDFTLNIWHASEDHVLEESAEVAQMFAKQRPDQAAIASCSRRFDISGTDDPDMIHFNDYCYVLQTIDKMGLVYQFSPGAQKFLDE